MADYHFPDPTDRFEIDSSAFIHPRALVNGTVKIGAESSVWPMAVIRGDEGIITIGARTSVQDCCVLHADPDAYLTIGNDVTIGHAAVVHGCTIGDNVLIGIGAVVLNWAEIGAGSIIAAKALVTEGMKVPPNSLVIGIPGQIKSIRPEQQARAALSAEHYVELGQLYRKSGEQRTERRE